MEPAKFCIECGKPLPPEAKHCPNCGADVTELHPASLDDVQQMAPTPQTQGPPPQSATAGPYSVAPMSPPVTTTSQPAQAAPYGGPGAAPRSPYANSPPPYPQPPMAAGFQRARSVTSAKRLGGGFIAVLGGIVMVAFQVYLIVKSGTPVNALGLQGLMNLGLGVLCLATGVIMIMARGWGSAIVAALLSGGVFALCGLKLYEIVQLLQTQAPEVTTGWVLQSGGIVWIGGLMLGMIAFTKAFQSLFSRR